MRIARSKAGAARQRHLSQRCKTHTNKGMAVAMPLFAYGNHACGKSVAMLSATHPAQALGGYRQRTNGPRSK